MTPREQFEELNLQLIEARKVVKERDRILDILDGIDVQKREIDNLLANKERQLKRAWADYETPFRHLVSLINENSKSQQALQKYQALRTEILSLQSESGALDEQIMELEDQLTPFADCDNILNELEASQLQFILENDLHYAQSLNEVIEKLAQAGANYREYEEALAWRKQAISQLTILNNEVQALIEGSKPRFLDDSQGLSFQLRLDRLSVSALEVNYKTYMVLTRYVRELADTDLEVSEGFLDHHPFNKPFHIPFELNRRSHTLARWQKAVNSYLKEVKSHDALLQVEIEKLRNSTHNLNSDRQILLNLIWQESNFN